MNIFICGFSGAGKSTFLQRMHEADSAWGVFLDLDSLIEKAVCSEGQTLGDWIRGHGFEEFRVKETEQLSAVLRGDFGPNVCVSLGGGALSEKNYNLIRQDKTSSLVYLNTPFDVCYERIRGDNNRPLSAKSREDLFQLHRERELIYDKSDLVLDQETAKEIEGPTNLVHNLLRVSRKENGP